MPTDPIAFFVPGTPKPMPRPRVRVLQTRRGPVGQLYYPRTKNRRLLPWARWYQAVATAAADYPRTAPKDCPLLLLAAFYFTGPPKRHKGSKRYEATAWRGDIDNHLKLVMDAMTKGGIWEDDGRVSVVEARKCWANGVFPAGVDIVIRRLEPNNA